MAGGPGKEHETNKPPPTGRVQEGSKGDTTCPSTSQNPSRWRPSWLSNAWATRKASEWEWLAKDNLETNPITIKPETVSHVAEQFSWVPLPYCSLPGCPSPIKSLALSAHVSPWTIHFWVSFWALEGGPFLQQMYPNSPQTPLLSRLPHNIEQSSTCYMVSPFWLSILNIAVCTWASQSL